MKTLWDKMQINNNSVDKNLLSELQRLNQTTKVEVPNTQASGFTINHPFDSNIFREAMKDSEKAFDDSDSVIAYSAMRW